MLSQGIVESIAPELAAILGLGSDRLPVQLKAFRTSDGIDLAFAVSTNPKQEGIVISALKTMTDKTEIYSVGTAWLTDRSGTLRQTIAVDGFGAKVLPNSSRAAKFKDIKAFFIKKLQATSPSTPCHPLPEYLQQLRASGSSWTESWPWIVAFTFGMLHGIRFRQCVKCSRPASNCDSGSFVISQCWCRYRSTPLHSSDL